MWGYLRPNSKVLLSITIRACTSFAIVPICRKTGERIPPGMTCIILPATKVTLHKTVWGLHDGLCSTEKFYASGTPG